MPDYKVLSAKIRKYSPSEQNSSSTPMATARLRPEEKSVIVSGGGGATDPVELKSRALVIGHYGAGNLGDDLMLAAVSLLLSDRNVDISIFAKSEAIGDALCGKSQPSEIIIRGSLIKLLGALNRADFIVLGGGTHFQDNFKARRYVKCLVSIIRFLALFGVAKLMKKKVAWIGVGVGPIKTRLFATLVKNCAQLTDVICVRDKSSRNELEKLKVSHSRCGFDLAAVLPVFNDLQHTDSVQGLVLGVSLFSAPALSLKVNPNTQFWESWLAAIEGVFSVTSELHIKLFVFLNKPAPLGDLTDINVLYDRLKKIAPERVKKVPYTSAVETVREIAACNRFLAARYHSVITAGLLGLPMIVAPYDRKVIDVAQQFGLKDHAILNTDSDRSVPRLVMDIEGLLMDPADFLPALTCKAANQKSNKNAFAIDYILQEVRGHG